MTKNANEKTPVTKKLLSLLLSCLLLSYQCFMPAAAYAVRKLEVTSTAGTWTVQGQPDGKGKVYFGGQERSHGVLAGTIQNGHQVDFYTGPDNDRKITEQWRISDGVYEFRKAVFDNDGNFVEWTPWTYVNSTRNIYESGNAALSPSLRATGQTSQIVAWTTDVYDNLRFRVYDDFNRQLPYFAMERSGSFMGTNMYNVTVDRNVSYQVDITGENFAFTPQNANLGLYVNQSVPWLHADSYFNEYGYDLDYLDQYGPHKIEIKDSNITGNNISARQASGLITLGMGYGYVQQPAGQYDTEIKISDTKIKNNTFTASAAGTFDFGIYAFDQYYTYPGTLRLENLEVTGNTVQSTASFSQGVYINSVGLNNGVETVVKDTYFNNNEYKGTAKNDQGVKGLNIYNSGNLVLYKNGHGTIQDNSVSFLNPVNTTGVYNGVSGVGLYNIGTAVLYDIDVKDNSVLFQNAAGAIRQVNWGTGLYYYDHDGNASVRGSVSGVGIGGDDHQGELSLVDTAVSGNNAIANNSGGSIEMSGIGVYSAGTMTNVFAGTPRQLEISGNYGYITGNMSTTGVFDETKSDGTIVQTTATVGGSYTMDGAGVYFAGRRNGGSYALLLNGATITDNGFVMKNASGRANYVYMHGGGMYSVGSETDILNTSITNNILQIGADRGANPSDIQVETAHLKGGGLHLIHSYDQDHFISHSNINSNKIIFNAHNAVPSYIYGDCGLMASGGGIYNWGQGYNSTLTIKESSVNNNEVYSNINAIGHNIGYLNFESQGGGIFTDGIRRVNINDTNVIGNSLTAEMSNEAGRYMKNAFLQGGGIFAETGSSDAMPGIAYITSSDGMSRVAGNSISFTMKDTNQGAFGSGIPYHVELDGGGIYKGDYKSYDYANNEYLTPVFYVQSEQNRLGIVGNTITFNNFSGVKRYDDIYARGGGISVMHEVQSIFENINVRDNAINMISTKPGDTSGWGWAKGDLDAEGGGIAFSNPYDSDHLGTQLSGISISAADIANNTITMSAVSDDATGRGGGLFARLSGTPQDGTAMYLEGVNIYDNSIKINSDYRATAEGGGLWANLYRGYDKSIDIQGVSANNEQVHIIRGNTASAVTSSEAREYDQARAMGGGIYLGNYQAEGETGNRLVEIKNYRYISENIAEAEAINAKNYALARGGAIYIDGFDQRFSTTSQIGVTINNIGEISNNKATATAKSGSETTIMDGDTWTDNYAVAEGGAIYVLNSNVAIYDTNFINNSAESLGAGVQNEYSRGGAIYIATEYGYKPSQVTIGAMTDGKDVIFRGNQAGKGSDIYMEDLSKLILLPGSGDLHSNVHNAIRFEGTIAGGNDTEIIQKGYNGTVYLSGDGKDFTGTYSIYDGVLKFNRQNNRPVDYSFRTLSGQDGIVDLMLNGSANDVVKIANLVDNRDFADDSANETLRLWVDFNAQTGDMDKLTVNAYTKNQNLNGQGQAYNTNPYVRLSMINVMEDGSAGMATYLDGAARNYIQVITDTITATTQDFTYTFTPDHNTHGLLHIISEQSSGLTLAEAIADPTRNSYSFTRDYVTNEDLGDLAYTDDDPENARQFTIFGNSHSLDGNGHDGVFVQENQELTVQNITEVKNFAGAAIYNQMANATENNGVVNIVNSSFADNEEDILNSGTLNLQSGTINFASGIKDHSGSNNYGTTNINGAEVSLGENAVIMQNALNINSGSLTAGADQIDAAVTNNGTLVLTGGNLASSIGGTGTTQITGDVTNTLGKTLGNDMSVSGSLATNADYIDGSIISTGSVSLTGGTLSQEISGGEISIAGNTSGNADYFKAVTTVNGQSSLMLTGGTVSAEINGQGGITIGGDVLTNADYLKTATVVNSTNTLTLNGGTLTYAVSGTGNLAIETDMTANLVNPITGIVRVASGKKLTLGANDAFAAADSLVLNDGTTLNLQNGSATAAAIDNIVIADGAAANALIKWNDTLDGSLEGQAGTLTIGSVDVGRTQAQAGDPAQSYTLTATLAENIALASDLTLANAGENTLNTVSYNPADGIISGKKAALQDIISETAAGSQATFVLTSNETGGGSTVAGNLKIQGGNGSTLESTGDAAGFIQVGDGLVSGATLLIEDVNIGEISTDGAEGSLVVKGGNSLEFRATNENVVIEGSDNGTGIYLEKDDILGAANALINAAGMDININDDIRSDDNGNIIRFAGAHEINFAGTFDPATAEVDTTLNRLSGYDEAITYNINAGGVLRYSADSTLYDSGHHTALTMNTVNFKGGVLRMDNGAATEIKLTDLSLTGTSAFYGDVDLANGSMDKFTVTNAVTGAGTLNVAGLNLLSDAAADNTVINFTDDATLMGAVNYTGGQGLAALSPVYRYNVSYNNADGNFTFARLNNGNYTDFNPAAAAGQAAALAGGYLSQLNSHSEAFRSMDDMMSMTESQREGLSSGDEKGIEASLFARPYASFEKVPLKNGPKVSNDMYGTYFGYEAPVSNIGGEWNGIWSAYIGYNHSSQSYDGVDITQNGALAGAAGMAYKGNLYAGVTVNAGMSSNDVSADKGGGNFNTGTAGLAAKAGYAYDIDDGRYTLLPSLMLAYSYVNAGDYTNSAGAKIKTDALNALQIMPEVRFRANLKNGWKPYAGIAAAFNMGGADAGANNAALPEMSVKNYVKYGGGAGKSFGNITGYGDVYFISGGRRSVSLNAGIAWKFGGAAATEKNILPNAAVSEEKIPEPVNEEVKEENAAEEITAVNGQEENYSESRPEQENNAEQVPAEVISEEQPAEAASSADSTAAADSSNEPLEGNNSASEEETH